MPLKECVSIESVRDFDPDDDKEVPFDLEPYNPTEITPFMAEVPTIFGNLPQF